MMPMLEIFTRGAKKGLNLTWELVIKIVLPVYIIVSLLTYTPVIPWLSASLSPFMSFLGLPGEAALPLVLGALVSFYAGLGAVVPLGLGPKELTIVAAMLLLAHDLPVEAAVSKKSGSRIVSLMLIRVLAACAFGISINYLF
ncbi:MAG: nucleoside recognition protein [Syntrophomonadaceae bacterium]|jgi:spore maturation protein SpmB|nr:nucleoside recognition protein [Syntrophomonadaceae bacterium]